MNDRTADLGDRHPGHAVAVIGMALRVPGAATPEAFRRFARAGAAPSRRLIAVRWQDACRTRTFGIRTMCRPGRSSTSISRSSTRSFSGWTKGGRGSWIRSRGFSWNAAGSRWNMAENPKLAIAVGSGFSAERRPTPI